MSKQYAAFWSSPSGLYFPSTFMYICYTGIGMEPFTTTWTWNHIWLVRHIRHPALTKDLHILKIFIPCHLSLFMGNIVKWPISRQCNKCLCIWLWSKMNFPGCFAKQSAVANATANAPQSLYPSCLCKSMNFKVNLGLLVCSKDATCACKQGLLYENKLRIINLNLILLVQCLLHW